MKIAVLASGSGTILRSIMEHKIPIELVLADKECQALRIASEAANPIELIDRREFGYKPDIGEDWDREGFTRTVVQMLIMYDIDIVAMAGFGTIMHPVILETYQKRVLNIHPALLPDFKGEHAVRDALAAGVAMTGTTIHIATEEVDDATYILAQAKVPVLDGDDEKTLHERIKVQERELYPRVLRDILDGTINLDEVEARS